MIQQMLKLHNEVRKKHNLHPLSLHPKLQKLAQQHAADMQKNKKITHADFGKRIKEAGYPLAPGAGTENLASGGGESRTAETWASGAPPTGLRVSGIGVRSSRSSRDKPSR